MHCEQCGEVAVPDDQLPVVLPDLRGADLKPKGVSPLAAATGWPRREITQRLRELMRSCEIRKQGHLDSASKGQKTR